MISDSVPLMTTIDLLILAVIAYGTWRCRVLSLGRRFERPRICLLMINLGLLAIALFYAADLAIMHVLPMVSGMEKAMEVMTALHRNLNWLVIPFAVVSISIGFIELLVELERRESRVRRLIDANIVGIFVWDPSGRLVDANEAFLRLTGYSRDELLSKRLGWTELTPAETRAGNEQRLAELKATRVVRPYETEYVQKNGGGVPVLVGMATFEEASEEGVAFVIDLTDQKKAEQAYTQVQMELAHANRVATIGHLTASIAHEIKQPIGAAIAYANAGLNWLGSQPPNLDEARRAFAMIVEAGVRVGDIIERTRTLVKKAPARRDALAINETILEVVALTRHEAAKNRVCVQLQLTEGLPPVQGDRVQLQQVVLNLIINAVEAMGSSKEGTRQLLINTDRADQQEIRIVVQDSGPGMAPESIDRVFDPFYTTKSSGLGIGLSICRSIIEAHEGRLWVTVDQPKGAVFAFTLPVRPGNPL